MKIMKIMSHDGVSTIAQIKLQQTPETLTKVHIKIDIRTIFTSLKFLLLGVKWDLPIHTRLIYTALHGTGTCFLSYAHTGQMTHLHEHGFFTLAYGVHAGLLLY